MIRNDGVYKIYRIQHQQKDGEWVFSSFDHFGTPETDNENDKFSASGLCWQQTGEHGVYDLEVAKIGLKNMKKLHKFRKFRLVLVDITQITIPI